MLQEAAHVPWAARSRQQTPSPPALWGAALTCSASFLSRVSSVLSEHTRLASEQRRAHNSQTAQPQALHPGPAASTRQLRPTSGHTLLLTVLRPQISPVCPPGPVPERLCLPGSVLPSPCGRPYTGEDTARSSSSGPCRLGRTGEFGAGACTLLIPAFPEPQEPGEGVKAHPVPRQVT